MTSIVTKTIKPGGGGDYTSLSAAISGEAASSRRDLTGNDTILRFELWANGTTGLAMTTGQAINYSASAASGSFRTDRTRYIWIDTNPSERHVGLFDASKAKIKKAGGSAWGNGYLIFGSVDIKITGQTIEWGYNTGDSVTLFYPNGGAPGHNQYYEVDSNVFHATGTYSAGIITFIEDGYSDPEVLKVTNNVVNGATSGFYQSLQLQPLVGERMICNNTFRLVGNEVIGAVGLLASPNPTSRVIITGNIGAIIGTHTNILFPGMPGTVPANWMIAGNYSAKAEGVGNAAMVVESATFTFTDATNGDLSLASGDASGAKTGGYTGHEQQFVSLPFRNDATSPTLRRPIPWSAGAIQYGGEGTGPQVSGIGLAASALSGDIAVPYPPFLAEDIAHGDAVGLYLELGANDAVTSGLAADGWTACPSNNTNTASGNLRTEVWAKAATGSETGSKTVARTSGGICGARMYSARGINTTSLFNASSVIAATSGATLNFATMTTTIDGARVQAFAAVQNHTSLINAAPTGASLTWAKHAIHAVNDPRARVIYRYGSNAWANPNAANRTAISQKVQIPIPAQAKPGDQLLFAFSVRSLTITLNSTDLTASGLTQGGSDQVERTDTTAVITTRYYEKTLTTSDVIPGYIQIALTSNAWWTAVTVILRNVGSRATLAQGMNGTTNGGTSQTGWTWPSITISSANGIASFFGGSDVRHSRQNTKTAGQTWGGTFTLAPDDGFTSGDGTYEYSQSAGCPNATSTNFNSTAFAFNTYPTNGTALGATFTMNAAGRGATFALFHPPASSATVGVGMLSATGGIKATAGSVASVTATLSSAAVKTGILYAIAPLPVEVDIAQDASATSTSTTPSSSLTAGTLNIPSATSSTSASTTPASSLSLGTLNIAQDGSIVDVSTSPSSTLTPGTLNLTTTVATSASTVGAGALDEITTVTLTTTTAVSTSTTPTSTFTPGNLTIAAIGTSSSVSNTPDSALALGTLNLTPSASVISTSTTPASSLTPGTLNVVASAPAISASTTPASTLAFGTFTLVATVAISSSQVQDGALGEAGTIALTTTTAVSTSTTPASSITADTLTLTPGSAIGTSTSPASTLSAGTINLTTTSGVSSTVIPASTLTPTTLILAPIGSALSASTSPTSNLAPQTLAILGIVAISQSVAGTGSFSGTGVMTGDPVISVSTVGNGSLTAGTLFLIAASAPISTSVTPASTFAPQTLTFSPSSAISSSVVPDSTLIKRLLGESAVSDSVVPPPEWLGGILLQPDTAFSLSMFDAATLIAGDYMVAQPRSGVSISVVFDGVFGPVSTPQTKDPFARIRLRAANVIARFGSDVYFETPSIPSKPNGVGGWTVPVASVTFKGKAIQSRGEPEGIDVTTATAGLVLKDPIVVLVAAQDLSGTPRVDMRMLWTGERRIVRNVQPIAPNGEAIYYVVVADI